MHETETDTDTTNTVETSLELTLHFVPYARFLDSRTENKGTVHCLSTEERCVCQLC